jgi:predicted alpha/beta superfamily hydrolase
MIKYLSENSVCPDMIVVGIPNTDRTRDLTPTHSLTFFDGTKSDGFKSSGGGEKFTSFLEKELIPHIDSIYPVAPYKMLIGHSFGGLTVMNIVINHPNIFNSYVAIDPSMWWDSHKLLNQAQDAFEKQKFDGKMLYMGIANTMPAKMDTLQVRVDTSGSTDHIRSILKLKDILQRDSKTDGLNFGYAYYKNDDHGSVPFITEYDALHFLFSFYKMPADVSAKMLDRKIKFDPAAAFTSHYADISKHLGYTVLPPEDQVANLAVLYSMINLPDRVYSLLALNIKNYPDSFNANKSMADYYLHQKDKAKAVEFYGKALKLKEDPGTKKKLDSLQR